MNQILITFENNKKTNNIFQKNRKKLNFYIFIFSIVLTFIIFFYMLYSKFILYKKNSDFSSILEKYQISTLYPTETQYNAIELSNNISIIGLIEIPSISISYPILSQCNEELLKISVCKFSGSLPNRTGNLCIVGHNYKNSLMFSKIDDLKIDESIFISDLNKNKLEYKIYKKHTINENDLSCISQSNNIEITLITCNKNNNKKRTVIKAKVKE